MEINYPIKVPALEIEQPLGIFYILALPASVLLETCHSIKAEILEDEGQTDLHSLGKVVDTIVGTQREKKKSRLEEIKRYSESVDACFPNAIILGANYNEEGMLVADLDRRWKIESSESDCHYLTIPSNEKLASIIDGQHRVYGFQNSKVKDMKLLCSVFIDLPMPYHAQLFTKINTTQKRVDKNLAYNLFQFDMAQGDSDTWSPETLAVYFARVLASDENSPLRGKLKLGISGVAADSTISMASLIDGILSLITSNAEKDRSEMHSVRLDDGRTRDLLTNLKSSAPLRQLYLHNRDKSLYNIIHHYFEAIDNIFWHVENRNTIFRRTLGIHACLDYLKEVTLKYGPSGGYDREFFIQQLIPASEIDFDTEFFGVQTKVRTRLRNTLLVISGIKDVDDLKCSLEDKEYIRSLET